MESAAKVAAKVLGLALLAVLQPPHSPERSRMCCAPAETAREAHSVFREPRLPPPHHPVTGVAVRCWQEFCHDRWLCTLQHLDASCARSLRLVARASSASLDPSSDRALVGAHGRHRWSQRMRGRRSACLRVSARDVHIGFFAHFCGK